MSKDHEIIQMIENAQADPKAADDLIVRYMPFIRTETAKFIKRIPQEGLDDELSIAMFAFYEAAMSYRAEKGSFIKLASLSIRNRLIDHYRKEKRHMGTVSLEQPVGDEDGRTLKESVDTGKDEIAEHHGRAAAKAEIMEFAGKLAEFGITLTDVADSCPQQTRTKEACMKVLEYARQNPGILLQLEQNGRLPIAQLALGAGIEKKTIERHRKYVVAILLAYTNGYEIIRGHLYHIRGKGV